jgi:esterase/lipase
MVKRLTPLVKTMLVMNKNALTPEVKMDMNKFPDHLHHVLYDFDNPFQKKCFPLKSLIEMTKECNKIEQMISLHTKSKKFASKYIELRLLYVKTPIQITVGGKDDVVCNETAKKLYGLLPGDLKKSLIEIDELDHGPFYDNTLYKGLVK